MPANSRTCFRCAVRVLGFEWTTTPTSQGSSPATARADAADPAACRYVGIAPEANLISIKAGDDDGNATILDVITGLQFVVDHKDDYGIRVVNLSLESTTAGSYQTDPLEAAWFHGIVAGAAAGNRGTAPDAADHAPGNDPFVITVGAVDD